MQPRRPTSGRDSEVGDWAGNHHQIINSPPRGGRNLLKNSYMKKTKINGYLVECDDSTQVWVERGNYAASLAALQDTGILESRTGGEHRVNPSTIDAIVEWAESNGF